MGKRYGSQEKKKWVLLDPNKKYPKWIEWIRDYGYYYKGIFAVVAGIAVIAFCMAFLFSYQGADMRVFFVSTDQSVEKESYFAFVDNLAYYVSDIDGDRNEFLRDEMFFLSENPSTDEEKETYAKLDEIINHEETIAFIVDEFGYEYISERTKLRDLKFFQVVADDEYKFRLNDTGLLEGITLGDGRDYYVIMRYFEAENYPENYYLSGRTDLWVGMMLNNDQSEGNNVAISQK